jgi:hypothetical protein
MKHHLLLITSWLLAAVFAACNAPAAPAAEAPHTHVANAAAVPGDFLVFYDRFMTDSSFQLAHIQFPLAGAPGMARQEVAATGFFWQESDWKVHRYLPDQPFVFKFIPLADNVVVEEIVHENGQYAAERRFMRNEDSWELIFYADLYLTGQ